MRLASAGGLELGLERYRKTGDMAGERHATVANCECCFESYGAPLGARKAGIMDDAFGHWLAGFIDGEGCFYMTKDLAPAFNLVLRDDDREILEQIYVSVGSIGRFYARRRPKSFGPAGCDPALKQRGNPCAEWRVSRLGDLVELVRVLDAYPLRAKKAVDYAVWREAVGVAASVRGRNPRPDWSVAELARLRVRLVEGRRYRDHVMQVRYTALHDAEAPQLSLVV